MTENVSGHICVFTNNDALSIPDLARDVEARGFDGFFVPENTHMPIQRRRESPYPETRMKSLASLYDPFVTLGACAAVTEQIKLGISVCLLTHRDTLATAKCVSSLDAISNGRLILGVAGGFVAEAMENHGTPFKHRWRVVREKALAMRSIWQDRTPEFQGEFVNIRPLKAKMRPVQAGGPPIWIGSNHRGVADRVAEYADGWIVFEERYQGDPFDDLRAACVAQGRDAGDITVALMDAPHDLDGLRQRYDAGYREFIFIVPSDDEAQLHRTLDDLQHRMDRLLH